MIEKLVRFSVKNKLIIAIAVLAISGLGIFSMLHLPLDAIPDITNNQVQVVTSSPSLAPQEIEQFITQPIELSMTNIPGVQNVRSISRFGLSVITIVFDEATPTMEARQYVKEQLDIANEDIPVELGSPQMMPITTGLGEIYQYVLTIDPEYADKYDNMELRSIQDWVVKRQLMGTKGIIDVSSFGGFLKQYEVSIQPEKLSASNTTIEEVFKALESNNENSGGSYIEKADNAYYIRTEGMVNSLGDISNIIVRKNGETPVRISDVAEVKFGSPQRYGAMTMDGLGEVVGGITLMLKGANSSEAIENVQKRVQEIEGSLPEGVHIYPFLDRSVLVGKAIHTVSKNLVEGGLIVIFVLILLLGNFRAGLIVASVIPLSLLIAFIFMRLFGVSANLMSLGAIDFGIVVDGAVIVVEGVLHLLFTSHLGKKLNQQEMDEAIIGSSSSIISSAAFGVLIIVVVFIPILSLSGIEGKMFTPMAQTVSFAILGALILSMTYIPMMSSLFLKKSIKEKVTLADKLMNKVKGLYSPVLSFALKRSTLILFSGIALFISAILLFGRLGAEFVPTLDEGDLAMQVTLEPGSSLTKMIETTLEAEKILKNEFPEVKHVVAKIGTAEIPTDPMAIEDADVMILMKDKSEWTSANSREEISDKMKKSLSKLSHAEFNFTQPIQLRFNELISGAKSDIAVKLYGENLDTLSFYGAQIENKIRSIQGAGDVKMEQTDGLPQLMVRIDRDKLTQHHVNVKSVNQIIRSAYAGAKAGVVLEDSRRFDLVVRLENDAKNQLDLGLLQVINNPGEMVPLSDLCEMELVEGPMMITREDAQRRVSVGVNVRNRDIESFVNDVSKQLNYIKLPSGYYLKYGGQFENLQAAKKRLSLAVPIALILIFILLYFAFGNLKYALLIYAAVPLSAVGGVFALVITGMPFSISAGVGFIALFGVAVLNGIVLVSYINNLKSKRGNTSISELIKEGSLSRLRPVLMTAAVASIGFLPMALSTGSGAEVQKPLAIVVIGGLISATLLTLVVLPALYNLTHKNVQS